MHEEANIPPERASSEAASPLLDDRLARTRREFLGAAIVAAGGGIVIFALWLISRSTPSAERDPALAPPGT